MRTDPYPTDFAWGGREGAACDDLAPVAIDKYLAAPEDFFARKVGLAICSRCVVMDECRADALNARMLPKTGVVGGVTVGQIRNARSWRFYEQGGRETPPRGERPEWLPRTDATETVEQMWVEEEHGVER